MTQAPFVIATARGNERYECKHESVTSSFSGLESYGLVVNEKTRTYSLSFGQGNKPQTVGKRACNYPAPDGIKMEMADLRQLDVKLTDPRVLKGTSSATFGPITTTMSWFFQAQ
jgi:hypothetical protein